MWKTARKPWRAGLFPVEGSVGKQGLFSTCPVEKIRAIFPRKFLHTFPQHFHRNFSTPVESLAAFTPAGTCASLNRFPPRGTAAAASAKNMPPAHFLHAAASEKTLLTERAWALTAFRRAKPAGSGVFSHLSGKAKPFPITLAVGIDIGADVPHRAGNVAVGVEKVLHLPDGGEDGGVVPVLVLLADVH